MAKLVLRPTMHDFDREGIETYLKLIRAKRMAATVEYFQTKNRKLELRQDALSERIKKQIEMLDKELGRMEVLEQKIEERLNNIQELENEYSEAGERVVEVDDA